MPIIRLVEDRLPAVRWSKDPQGALSLLQPRWGSLIDLLEESAAYMLSEPFNPVHNVLVYKQLVKELIFYSLAGSELRATSSHMMRQCTAAGTYDQ